MLFTGGFAMLVFAACYWAIDLRGWRKWAAPALVFGRNAILAYAVAALVSEISTDFDFHFSAGRAQTLHGWFYNGFIAPHASPINASLAFAVIFVALIFVMLLPFYRWKIFLRV